jgi:outer membrane receptor protein involved in Fe transport
MISNRLNRGASAVRSVVAVAARIARHCLVVLRGRPVYRKSPIVSGANLLRVMPHRIPAPQRRRSRSAPARGRTALGALVGAGLLLPAMVAAAEAPARRFDLPAGDAAQTLKQFAAQAGAQILYSARDVGGIATQPLQGEYPPLVAIEHMLQGTPLKAREDPATRAIAVTRAAASPRTPPSAADTPAPSPAPPKTAQPQPKEFPAMKKRIFLTFLAGLFAAGTATDAQTGVTPPKEEPVALNPFEVVADATDTYDATNTNSVTGTALSLNKTPLDAKIYNRTIMDELGVVDVAMMLSDLAGLGAPFLGVNEDQRGVQDGDGRNYKAMMSRGLQISNPRRDGFLRSDTSLMDSFDVESVEAMQGSNSLLFGSGDAGGVININSKRARLNRRSAMFSAKLDSEGTVRFATDLNAGSRLFALRVNGVTGTERYYRPILRVGQEGLQVAATARPVPWFTASAEYRHYIKDHIRSGNLTLRTPASLRLPNGEALDNKSVRYVTGLGGSALLDNYLTFTNQDSGSGALLRHYYVVASYAVALEASASRDLHFQFRYGKDERVNDNTSPTSSVLFHPDAPGNLYTAPDGTPLKRWAMNTSVQANPTAQGAEGYKLTGVYHRKLGCAGDHWLNAFVSQQDTFTTAHQWRYFETDAHGQVIQQGTITDANSGQIIMPAAWIEPFPTSVFGRSWPADFIRHPNGKTYKLAPMVYPGAVPPTPQNPLGISGRLPAAGGPPVGYTRDETRERAKAVSLTSEFWGGRINTMAGFRFETADTLEASNGTAFGPLDYDTSTLGLVVDTPVRGVRVYANRATNAKVTFGTARDIYDQLLPVGEGISREIGLKFSMWDHRLSGNVSYYISEGRNFPGELGALRDDVNPNGINGRTEGSSYVFTRKSDGLDLSLTMRPLRAWQITLNYSEADGSERSDVSLPILYNDEFNTTTVNGQTVVGVRGAGGAIAPLVVRSNPADPGSAGMPLAVAMLRDPGSPYFAQLDPDSGQILNATAIGLATAGVGTGRIGLPISFHQLGFTPVAPEIIVRRAGERTTGYPEHSFSIINRYQFGSGPLRGLVAGLTSVYQTGIRGYRYTDAADGGLRKTFYHPDWVEHRFFGRYAFKLPRSLRASVQLNISNLLDKQELVALRRSTDGTIRYFAQRYSPRKFVLTTSVAY